MIFSQEQFKANISNDNEPIDAEDLAYFSQRTKNGAFQNLMRIFSERAEEHGLTKTTLASRLGKDKAQITRLFAGPKNWTLDTLSELSLALGYEAKVTFIDLSIDPRHNYCHPLVMKTAPSDFHFEVRNGKEHLPDSGSTSTAVENITIINNA